MTFNDLNLPVSRNALLVGGGALLIAAIAAVLLAPRGDAPGAAAEGPREVILPDGQRLDLSTVPEARPIS